MRFLLIAGAGLALLSCNKASQPTANQGSAVSSQPTGKGVDRTHKGTSAPKIAFNDSKGSETTLAAFAGKPTLVNLWASWCAPCIKELPTLDSLAKSEGSKLNVVAISQDDAPHASVVAFLQAHKIATLQSYQDPKSKLLYGMGAEVLPTSVLFDSSGKEVWRYVGDQDWTSPAAAKLLAEGGVGS
ncbi:MAG TPA: TlpA disulfide reductase family protein [Sphingomicrobium sp.]|nr:TlpA disulfide reductase family protein [Sphingomicrobium sp.]